MTKYLITFPSNAMDHVPETEMPDVARAAHAVCQEAIDAGVYFLAGVWKSNPRASWLPTGRSRAARSRTSSAASRSWTFRHARRR
jgi:hypothetical protein